MVCHLLNNDTEKAKGQFKGLSEISDIIEQLNEALDKQYECYFGDLSAYFPHPHISQFLPSKTIPNTQIHLKLSIPFP